MRERQGNPVYTIGLLNFNFAEGLQNAKRWHHEVKLMEVDTHEVLYDKLTYIYVEIPKFDNQERKLYEDSVNAYRDIVNAIRTAEKKKFAEGMAKGEKAAKVNKEHKTPDGLPQKYIIKCHKNYKQNTSKTTNKTQRKLQIKYSESYK